ncbi:MAG: hypothetical protein ACI4TJ_05630 [Candidatus Cryptobacteroides sp.]
MGRKKKNPVKAPSAVYLARQKSALVRRHRQVIYLNDKEKAAVEEYCSRFGVKNVSSVFREATMERILSQLDECPPSLF